jgi:hypothetical protein
VTLFQEIVTLFEIWGAICLQGELQSPLLLTSMAFSLCASSKGMDYKGEGWGLKTLKGAKARKLEMMSEKWLMLLLHR